MATPGKAPILAGFFLVLCLFGGKLAIETQAHPAHAKPVNYPYVVGFERFHSSLDDDEYLSIGGMILLNELNCVACHEPPRHLDAQFPGLQATRLDGVASRLDSVNLEIMIRNPRFVKRDTIMPSLFAGPDRDLEEVEALKHYLSTLTYEVPEYPRGEIEAGRRLYHRIGCAACHAPEVGYRPVGIPDNAEIELAGLPSVPMNLADLYQLDTLTHFLLSPNQHRPSGRMPDFRLTTREAADLAAYLKEGPDLVLPENLTRALGESGEFVVDPDLARRGRALFAAKNCVACHEIPGESEAVSGHEARPLADLPSDSTGGCLSERPPGGRIPFYGLDVVQKRAIRAALERLDLQERLDLAGQIDWRMKRLNCYACHERDGIGGPETAREVYFGWGEEKAVELGRPGHLPPALDQVGAKLKPAWMKKVLLDQSGDGSVRPYMPARMPLFLSSEVEPLVRQFDRADQVEAPAGGGFLTRKAEGEVLFAAEGKNCVRCHSAGEIRSSEFPGIDLATSKKRLDTGFFRFFLLEPYSLHPPRISSDPPNSRPPLNEDEVEALSDWIFSLGE